MCLVAVCWQFITYNGFPNDHYFHVARARQMLLGDWPVRDFVDVGAPLMYVISAASRWLFGDIARAPSSWWWRSASVWEPRRQSSARRGLSRSTIVATGVALLEILASPRSYSYPKMLLYGLAGCLIVAIAAQASRARLFTAAGLTAVAFLMRHDHGLFIGAACAMAIVLSAPGLADAARRVGRLRRRRRRLAGAVGRVGAVPPGSGAVLRDGNRCVASRSRHLGCCGTCHICSSPAGLTTANVHAWLVLPVLDSALSSVVVLALWRRITRRERWAGESVAVGAIALIALALDASFLRNPLETRLADAMVPGCLLGAWLLGLVWMMKGRLAFVIPVRLAASVLFAVTAVAIWGVGDVHDKLDEVGVFEDDLEHLQQHTAAVVNALTQPEMDRAQAAEPRLRRTRTVLPLS